MLLGCQWGLADMFCGSVWWIVLYFGLWGLLRLAAGLTLDLRTGSLHLGDGLHRLGGSTGGLVQAEVLGGCLFLLPNGGQLRLREDIFGDGAFSAAGDCAATVTGPPLLQALLWVLLLGGVPLSWQRLQVTENRRRRQFNPTACSRAGFSS